MNDEVGEEAKDSSLVASISSEKWKTMASVESDKGQRRESCLGCSKADRRRADGVTEGV